MNAHFCYRAVSYLVCGCTFVLELSYNIWVHIFAQAVSYLFARAVSYDLSSYFC